MQEPAVDLFAVTGFGKCANDMYFKILTFKL